MHACMQSPPLLVPPITFATSIFLLLIAALREGRTCDATSGNTCPRHMQWILAFTTDASGRGEGFFFYHTWDNTMHAGRLKEKKEKRENNQVVRVAVEGDGRQVMGPCVVVPGTRASVGLGGFPYWLWLGAGRPASATLRGDGDSSPGPPSTAQFLIGAPQACLGD